MRKKGLLLFLMMSCMSLYAQPKKELSVLFVCCKEGVLLVDGEQVATVAADDASKQLLNYGEHYIQLKTATEKFNITLNIDESSKTIVRLGCEQIPEIRTERLVNKQVSLMGALSQETEQNVFALDKGDELVINSNVKNAKGTATLFIVNTASNFEIYRKQDFRTLQDQKVKIHQKGIYKVSLYTDALFGKEAQLTLDRIPSLTSSSSFSTRPVLVYDTTYTEILKTNTRVYSTTNADHDNKTFLKINLPPNTSYWCYWIGVDQSAQNSMKEFTSNLSPVLSAISVNPLVLYGMKLIPSLPMMNTPSTVDYKFMDSRNAEIYKAGGNYSYFLFKHANNITTDYAITNTVGQDIVLAMMNNNTWTGYNVEVRAVAFVVRSRLTIKE